MSEGAPRRRWPFIGGLLLLGLSGGAYAGSQALADWVYADLPPPLFSPCEPLPGLASLSAATCAGCHATIAAEWAGSAHGRAHTDPLYQADLRDEATPFVCERCHTPLVEQRPQVVEGLRRVWPNLVAEARPNPRYDPVLQAEGVTCVACHQRPEGMAGPHRSEGAPHPTVVTDALARPAACAGCHHLEFARLGEFQRPLMETLTEWEAYRAAGGERSCVDCHMPAVEPRPLVPEGTPRPGRSHALRGPSDPDFVRSAIELGAAEWVVERSGLRLSLSLFNATGHRLPTAEPQRRLELSLEVLDANGRVLAREALRIQRVVDVHALREAPGQDSSLLPRETRRLELTLPGPLPPEAQTARWRLRFVLWEADDPLLQEAGIDPSTLVHELAGASQPLPPG